MEDPTKKTSVQLEALDAIEGCLKASPNIHNESAVRMLETVANDRQSNIDVRLGVLRLIYLVLKPDYKKHEFIKRIATIMQVDGGLSIKEVSIVIAEEFWADLEREKIRNKFMLKVFHESLKESQRNQC